MSKSASHPTVWLSLRSRSTVELLRNLGELDDQRLRIAAEADLISNELSRRRGEPMGQESFETNIVTIRRRPQITLYLDGT